MIPLSNGRSPRIDQFYATLRTYKSHQFQQDHNTRTQEDKSIEHIRSLGKQIFEEETGRKKIKVQKQSISALHRSQQSIRKAPNLYQKYKEQRNKQIGRQVNRMKQIVIKEEANKKVNKNLNSNKYIEVKSKIPKKGNQMVNGLNYEKKSDMQAQRIKKQKMEMQQVEKQMKQKQMLFEKSSKSFRSSQQSLFNGVLKRAQQMKLRKQQLVQQMRNQQLLKQMSGVTFQPTKISKEFGRVEPVFEKRLSLAQTQRISREKSILKQVVQEHSFKPQLNQYKSAKPKVENSWKESRIGDQQRTERSNRRQSVNQTNLSNDERNKTSYKSSQNPTANSTIQINLKTVNEISFIFE